MSTRETTGAVSDPHVQPVVDPAVTAEPAIPAEAATMGPADRPLVSAATTNACRMCMPLGAALAFAGVEATMPFLHGSQGCATYIRRYLISHFSEPLDIASSSVGEAATVFGGEANLATGIANVTRVYDPQLIGVASTCLTETIGEDVPAMLARIRAAQGAQVAEAPAADGAAGPADPVDRVDPVDAVPDGAAPPSRPEPLLVSVATPSYAGTHADGFHAAVAAIVEALADPRRACEDIHPVVVLPGIVSTADLRHLREIAAAFTSARDGSGPDSCGVVLLPDWSERLDGGTVGHYAMLPAGGTAAADIAALPAATGAISLGGLVTPGTALAGDLLAQRYGLQHRRLPLPIGIRLSDLFIDALAELTGSSTPGWLEAERGRLVDAYVDGHKYVAEKTAVLYGDEDLVAGLAVFLAEIGVTPLVCGTGGRSRRLESTIYEHAPELQGRIEVVVDTDFEHIRAAALAAQPDLLIGHSKGYHTARELGVPLVRVGLPIHDRTGGQRVAHLGYRGAQALFDRIANALIAHAQDSSPVAYSYM